MLENIHYISQSPYGDLDQVSSHSSGNEISNYFPELPFH